MININYMLKRFFQAQSQQGQHSASFHRKVILYCRCKVYTVVFSYKAHLTVLYISV